MNIATEFMTLCEGIESLARSKHAIISTNSMFNENGGGLHSFLDNSMGSTYALLDRNILIALRDIGGGKSFAKGNYTNNSDRLALGIIMILKLSNITLVPTLGLCEQKPGNEIVGFEADFSNVVKTLNLDILSVMPFIQGDVDVIEYVDVSQEDVRFQIPLPHDDRIDIHNAYIFSWIMAAKCIMLSAQYDDKLACAEAFLDWQYAEFALGTVSAVFFLKHLSPTHFSKMIKGHLPSNVQNLAWDLTLIQYWTQLQRVKQKNEDCILVTMDKAVSHVARRMTFIIQNESDDIAEQFRLDFVEDWGTKNKYGDRLFKKLTDHFSSRDCLSRSYHEVSLNEKLEQVKDEYHQFVNNSAR